MSNPQQPPPPHHNHPSSLLDPPLDYLKANNMVWSRGQRFKSNSATINMRSSSSTPLPPDPKDGAKASASLDQTSAIIRNSKKRSRSSRRAPTTVLTTDTLNFRALVQEFTGIPASPFTASPVNPRRIDLFGNTATTIRSSHLDPVPPSHLSRPFAPMVQPPSFVSSSPFSNSTTTTTSRNHYNNNYQLPSNQLGLPKQTQDLLNMNNPILSVQSPMQSPPILANYPNTFGAKSLLTNPWSYSHPEMGLLEEFGMSNGAASTHQSGLPSLVSSEEASLKNDNNIPLRWGGGVGLMKLNEGDRVHLKNFDVNYGCSHRDRRCRMNDSGSSLDLHMQKGSENVSSRGEGMVGSWIPSSN